MNQKGTMQTQAPFWRNRLFLPTVSLLIVLAGAAGSFVLFRPTATSVHAQVAPPNDVVRGGVIPAGWTDDPGSETLTAPNKFVVRQGFRYYVETHAWDPRDWPIENERTVTMNGQADGSIQSFVTQQLRWQPSSGRSAVFRVGAQPAARIASFSPTGGPTGTTVSVTGSNFWGATGVLFNGAWASSFHVISATRLTATVPTDATSGPIKVNTIDTNGVASSSSFMVGQTADPATPVPTTPTANPTPVPTTNPPSAAGGKQSTIVAAYWGTEQPSWTQLDQTHAPGTIAIANINAGPGSSYSSTLATQIQQAQAAGVRVVGYVITHYGSTPVSTIKSQVDTWYNWYHPDGIFFDNYGNGTSVQSYYQTLHDYVKGKANGHGTLVLANIAWTPCQCMMSTADIILIYEDVYSTYGSRNTTASWMQGYPASRFASIVYAASSQSEMQSAIGTSRQRNVGYMFVTDNTTSNYGPYNRLPTYWSAETTALSN